MKKIFLALTAVVLLASCGDKATDNAATTNTTPNANTPAAQVMPPVGDPAAGPQPTTLGAPPVVPQAAVDPNVKDPNPAHGAPKHRCDIPVGASLSTPIQTPQAGQGQPVQMQPQGTPVK